ncbi:MAG TPA: glycosyltransferase family 39 protein, partial [Luteolibacter sp.]|nr:glycosyltransferase family 39 protein [Luteolibacter sp.]
RRRVGDPAALLAAALLATSPLLAYYSRMFIHEMLLTLFGVAALLMALVKPRWGLAGLMVGLMFAAKESFAISILAWSAAALWLLWEERASLEAGWWRRWWRPLLLAASLALFATLLCYTHGFSHWRGAWDAVRTFFVYQTVEGHDKPWYYYVQLLVWPDRAPGVWWYGTPVAALALLAFARGFHPETRPELRRVMRFLGYSILAHLLIYSTFAYKTPWLACLPWAMICLLAGCALVDLPQRAARSRIAIAVLAILCLGSQWHQAQLACGRFDNDPRNPYAYVPTRRDVEGLEQWLKSLREMEPTLGSGRIAVVGRGYWPLPWYLRDFSSVGYWAEQSELPADLERVPLVLAMPDLDGVVRKRLEATHVAQARSLRNEVPVIVYVERGLWDRWKEVKEP